MCPAYHLDPERPGHFYSYSLLRVKSSGASLAEQGPTWPQRFGRRRVLMVAVLIGTGWRPLSSPRYWEELIPEGVGGEG